MKHFFSAIALAALTLVANSSMAQKDDKAKRPSPPAVAQATLSNGTKISINYSQPSVKGRVIGKDVEPFEGKIWRAGANEATVFETNREVSVEGQRLPAGKYAFFTIREGQTWTLIFNSVWNTWGAYDYDKNKDKDAAKVQVHGDRAKHFAEKLTYTITKDGTVTLVWGDEQVSFHVK